MLPARLPGERPCARSPYAPTNGAGSGFPYAWLVFGRRRESDTPAAATAEEPKPGGKGRPTPKRREAEAARKAATRPARNRREAMRRDRELARTQRLQAREALMRGDEKNLPPRDQGPVRRFARDFVDSRRSAAEFFFWIALIVLIGSFLPSPAIRAYTTLFWLVALIVIVVDSVVLGFRLRSELRRRFTGGESTRGVTPYALMRAMQIRKLRLPPPRVKPGTKNI